MNEALPPCLQVLAIRTEDIVQAAFIDAGPADRNKACPSIPRSPTTLTDPQLKRLVSINFELKRKNKMIKIVLVLDNKSESYMILFDCSYYACDLHML